MKIVGETSRTNYPDFAQADVGTTGPLVTATRRPLRG